MSLSFHKSFKLGPVRLNLSRSGLGTSVGVKGFRVGVGPRSSYLTAGRGGLLFRQNLSAGQTAGKKSARPLLASDGMREIDSDDVTNMKDEDSASLLAALNKVQARIQLFPIVMVLGILTAPFILPLLIFVPLAFYVRHLDMTNGTVILKFDLDAKAKQAFDEMVSAFQRVTQCDCAWHIHAEGKNTDLKKSAGATTSVRRSVIKPLLGMPKRVSCDVQVPALPAGRQTLYFFPDRILVFDQKKVGAISYATLIADVSKTRFIESGSVPSDAELVGTTWQYVNKSGGPDRRFKDNRELPIALYGELSFQSDTGLNELFQTSKVDPLHAFAAALDGMRELGSKEDPLPISNVEQETSKGKY